MFVILQTFNQFLFDTLGKSFITVLQFKSQLCEILKVGEDSVPFTSATPQPALHLMAESGSSPQKVLIKLIITSFATRS